MKHYIRQHGTFWFNFHSQTGPSNHVFQLSSIQGKEPVGSNRLSTPQGQAHKMQQQGRSCVSTCNIDDTCNIIASIHWQWTGKKLFLLLKFMANRHVLVLQGYLHTCSAWLDKHIMLIHDVSFASFCSYRKVYNKRSKQWTVSAEREPKTYWYVSDLQKHIVNSCINDREPKTRPRGFEMDDPRKIAPTIAAVPAPPLSELIENHRSRFPKKRSIETSIQDVSPLGKMKRRASDPSWIFIGLESLSLCGEHEVDSHMKETLHRLCCL